MYSTLKSNSYLESSTSLPTTFFLGLFIHWHRVKRGLKIHYPANSEHCKTGFKFYGRQKIHLQIRVLEIIKFGWTMKNQSVWSYLSPKISWTTHNLSVTSV